jgi:hypothetical protein
MKRKVKSRATHCGMAMVNLDAAAIDIVGAGHDGREPVSLWLMFYSNRPCFASIFCIDLICRFGIVDIGIPPYRK